VERQIALFIVVALLVFAPVGAMAEQVEETRDVGPVPCEELGAMLAKAVAKEEANGNTVVARYVERGIPLLSGLPAWKYTLDGCHAVLTISQNERGRPK